MKDLRTYLLGIVFFTAANEYLFSISIGNVEIRLFHLIIFLCFGYVIKNKKLFKITVILNVILFYIASVSFFNGYYESTVDFIKVILHQELAIVTFITIYALITEGIDIKKVGSFNYAGLLMGSLIGLLQFALYNLVGIELNLAEHTQMGDHLKWRVYSFFSEPNMFSIYYSFGLLFVLYHFKHKSTVEKIIYISPIILALLLSFSRGAILALLVVFFFESIRKNFKAFIRYALSFVLVFILVKYLNQLAPFKSEFLYRITAINIFEDPSSSQRLDVFISLYQFYSNLDLGNFIVGVLFGNGLSSFRYIAFNYDTPYNYFAMNIYVDLIFEFGLILTVAFITSIVGIFKHAEKKGFLMLRNAIILFAVLGLFYPIRNVITYQVVFFFMISLGLKYDFYLNKKLKRWKFLIYPSHDSQPKNY